MTHTKTTLKQAIAALALEMAYARANTMDIQSTGEGRSVLAYEYKVAHKTIEKMVKAYLKDDVGS